FSPFFQHIALFTNIVEQAVVCHGLSDTFKQCAALIAPRFEVERSVMTSLDTIYSNFFVAGREFWAEWLRQAERLFAIAEEGSSPLAQALNAVVPYVVYKTNDPPSKDGSQGAVEFHNVPGVPAKVFVIERLASLLLWSSPRWRVKSFAHPTEATSPDLVVLDALKITYARCGAEPYLETFRKLRSGILSRHLPGLNPLQGGIAPTGNVAATAGGSPQLSPPEDPPRPFPPQGVHTAPDRIRIVCASRKSREEFLTQTALGRSLSLRVPPEVQLRLFPGNSAGLARVYNIAVDESRDDPATLLFVHDDVYLSDFFWAERLRESLSHFDIVGVIGNRRRAAHQPSWYFSSFDPGREALTKDGPENFSGAASYGHGGEPELINSYGPAGQEVKLLDGVFLAARSATLWEKSIRFDERFDFHFYDLDFCRQAERAGLAMGTWPICIVHGSLGGFSGDGWRRGYDRYIEKWGD
ncbi:MAG: glycosyltransferase, partial [Steroidobacteraceae bacterium]